ncbi:MAG: DUF2085 domain-containing protein [Chloroflexi bacterium]|nr:MAG: DUF2085 domain-containing protein [Chloroflexota bacterium]
MIPIKVYTRQDCHLCEEVLESLKSLEKDYPHVVELIDIDSNRSLRSKFGEQVPVVIVGPYTMKAPITPEDLRITLGAVAIGMEQDKAIKESVSRPLPPHLLKWTKSDSIFYWLSRHLIGMVNFIVFVYLALPFLAPVLMSVGARTPARVIYGLYGFACHQLAFRSWFVFGEQPAYPRSEAGVEGLIPFEQAIGIPDEDILAARTFTGNEEVGFKIALCQRDVAIYAAIVGFGLLYTLTKRKLPAIPWYLWILFGLVPIGIDGVSQLLSQPPWSFLSYRESTPLLRTLTGAMFGFFTAWFGFPIMEQSRKENLKILDAKLSRIRDAEKK